MTSRPYSAVPKKVGSVFHFHHVAEVAEGCPVKIYQYALPITPTVYTTSPNRERSQS